MSPSSQDCRTSLGWDDNAPQARIRESPATRVCLGWAPRSTEGWRDLLDLGHKLVGDGLEVFAVAADAHVRSLKSGSSFQVR